MSIFSGKIRIGSRASKLALIQVAEVKKLLAKHISLEQIEIIPITTSGDKIQDRNLSEIGGKGLFVKELEEALISNKIDLAIHSAKDVPPFLHSQTELVAFTERLNESDCFISTKFNSIEDLPDGAVVGTSSARRKAILLRLRPDLQVVNFRGNVDTRLKKVENNEVDATILAACGLERLSKKQLSKEEAVSCPKGYKNQNIISKNIMLPAGGQGALAIQSRKEDLKLINLLQKINHTITEIRVKSERAFLSELGASCVTPVAVNAWIENDKLQLKTLILDYNGKEFYETNSSSQISLEQAIELGINAAKKTKLEAAELLSKICNSCISHQSN